MAPALLSVWCVPLRCAPGTERQLRELLHPDETARAARFATRALRSSYVVSHGALRLILSRFTGRNAAAIQFTTGPNGKWSVTGGPHFSLSRGDDVALVAVSSSGPIGVDVEPIRADLEIAALARPLVTAADVARIEALPPGQRVRAWLQAWTRLEAVAKASGAGLRDDRAGREDTAYSVWNLDIDDAHVGAVAAGTSSAHIVYEVFSDADLA